MHNRIIFFSALSLTLFSCTKDVGEIPEGGTTGLASITTDAKLWDYTKSQTHYYYYKNDSIDKIVSTSGFHKGSYFLEFNAKAKSVLGSDGKLPSGSTFPDSSLAIKALYTNGSTPAMYAVILKNSKSAFASGGWMWAIFNPDGSVITSITQSGSSCNIAGCHSGGRDHLLTFDAHP